MKYVTYNFDKNIRQLNTIFPQWQHNIDYTAYEDTVLFNNDIYICTTTHNSGLTFDVTKWMCINREQGAVKYIQINLDITEKTSIYQLPSNAMIIDIKMNIIQNYDKDVVINVNVDNADNELLISQDVSYKGIYSFNILNTVENGGAIKASFNKTSSTGNAIIYISYVDNFIS